MNSTDYDIIVSEVAKSLNMNDNFVSAVYKTYWKAIRNYIASLPLKEDLSDDEFSKLRPNINIPSIGKMHVSLDRYHRMRKKNNIMNNLKK